MANQAKRSRSKSKKVTAKPPIDYSSSDREKLDDEKSKNSSNESNLKSESKKFETNRLSREAKFELEKLQSRRNDRSSIIMSQERSKSRKYRTQSSGIIEPNLNFHFHQDKISDSTQRGISVHSRTRFPSNLRASSKAKLTSSRHNIHIENHIPDFPIPLLNESSEFLILPPKHFYHMPKIEKLNYANSNSKFKHHQSHKPNESYSLSHQNFLQQSELPQNNFLPNQLNEKSQHQFYPPEQSNQHFFKQNEQPMQIFHNQTNEPNHLYTQSQIPQQINQQMPQLSKQQIAQVGQQIQVDLNPQQAQLFLSSNPAQQAEIIGKIQQQVLGSQFPLGTQAEVQIQPQLNQQQNNGLSSIQQLEMTLQQLQNLYINPAVQQFQQQNQQPDLGMQYLNLQSQNQNNDLVNNSQKSTQQQIQNYLSLQHQQQQNTGMYNQNQQQQNTGMYNQNQQQQYYNVMPQDVQASGSQQSQNQQQYFINQNQLNTPIGLKSSKANMNFLGMMFDQQNQSQY